MTSADNNINKNERRQLAGSQLGCLGMVLGLHIASVDVEQMLATYIHRTKECDYAWTEKLDPSLHKYVLAQVDSLYELEN